MTILLRINILFYIQTNRVLFFQSQQKKIKNWPLNCYIARAHQRSWWPSPRLMSLIITRLINELRRVANCHIQLLFCIVDSHIYVYDIYNHAHIAKVIDVRRAQLFHALQRLGASSIVWCAMIATITIHPNYNKNFPFFFFLHII